MFLLVAPGQRALKSSLGTGERGSSIKASAAKAASKPITLFSSSTPESDTPSSTSTSATHTSLTDGYRQMENVLRGNLPKPEIKPPRGNFSLGNGVNTFPYSNLTPPPTPPHTSTHVASEPPSHSPHPTPHRAVRVLPSSASKAVVKNYNEVTPTPKLNNSSDCRQFIADPAASVLTSPPASSHDPTKGEPDPVMPLTPYVSHYSRKSELQSVAALLTAHDLTEQRSLQILHDIAPNVNSIEMRAKLHTQCSQGRSSPASSSCRTASPYHRDGRGTSSAAASDSGTDSLRAPFAPNTNAQTLAYLAQRGISNNGDDEAGDVNRARLKSPFSSMPPAKSNSNRNNSSTHTNIVTIANAMTSTTRSMYANNLTASSAPPKAAHASAQPPSSSLPSTHVHTAAAGEQIRKSGENDDKIALSIPSSIARPSTPTARLTSGYTSTPTPPPIPSSGASPSRYLPGAGRVLESCASSGSMRAGANALNVNGHEVGVDGMTNRPITQTILSSLGALNSYSPQPTPITAVVPSVPPFTSPVSSSIPPPSSTPEDRARSPLVRVRVAIPPPPSYPPPSNSPNSFRQPSALSLKTIPPPPTASNVAQPTPTYTGNLHFPLVKPAQEISAVTAMNAEDEDVVNEESRFSMESMDSLISVKSVDDVVAPAPSQQRSTPVNIPASYQTEFRLAIRRSEEKDSDDEDDSSNEPRVVYVSTVVTSHIGQSGEANGMDSGVFSSSVNSAPYPNPESDDGCGGIVSDDDSGLDFSARVRFQAVSKTQGPSSSIPHGKLTSNASDIFSKPWSDIDVDGLSEIHVPNLTAVSDSSSVAKPDNPVPCHDNRLIEVSETSTIQQLFPPPCDLPGQVIGPKVIPILQSTPVHIPEPALVQGVCQKVASWIASEKLPNELLTSLPAHAIHTLDEVKA
ncbi:hypothetical protein EON64_09650, partial [archaeon]